MKVLEKVNVLGYSDFERLVNEHFSVFKGSYNYVADIECDNDSYHLYESVLISPKYDWQKDDLNRFLAGETKWIGPFTILTALVVKDLLPEGHYLIHVSW